MQRLQQQRWSYLQDAPINLAILYRGDSVLNGMFKSSGEALKKFYVFKAMGAMLETPQSGFPLAARIRSAFRCLQEDPRDHKTVRVLVSNYEIINDVATLHPTKVAGTEIAVRGMPRRNVEYKDNRGYSMTVKNLPVGKETIYHQALSDRSD